jgi:hypothetical protein
VIDPARIESYPSRISTYSVCLSVSHSEKMKKEWEKHNENEGANLPFNRDMREAFAFGIRAKHIRPPDIHLSYFLTK